MKVEGSQKITAPIESVWKKLMDPEVLRRVMPGCEKLEPAGEHRFRAVLKAGVGPVKGTFSGEVTLSDILPERSYTLTSRVTSTAGFAEGVGKIELESFAGETLVRFSGEAKVGGMLASVGGRLVEAAAQKNIRETFANLTRELSTGPVTPHP
ncbi:MAG: SRPBCC family protein [Terriglobales bacterium]